MVTPRSINLQGLCILVADPNGHFRRLVCGMLREFGASEIIEVDSGEDVLETMRKRGVDVIVCEADMPDIDGFEVTRMIRRDDGSDQRNIPILVMTGHARASTIANARDCGANFVLAKPFSPAAIYDRLAWVASSNRPFVATTTYYGPDRRYKDEQPPGGIGRRHDDEQPEEQEAKKAPPPKKGGKDDGPAPLAVDGEANEPYAEAG